MAKDNSFDIVSKVEMQEVDNAFHQAKKEIETRFDFRGTKCSLEKSGNDITLIADDEIKQKSVVDVLEGKMVKRKVPLKNLSYGKLEQASGGAVRQVITIKEGIETDKAKEIVKWIKANSKKIQASIQGDQVRVSSKKIDDLQALMADLKGHDFDIDLQFINYR